MLILVMTLKYARQNARHIRGLSASYYHPQPRLGQKYLFTRFEETSRKKVLVILPTTPLEWTRFSYFGDPNTPPAKFVAGHEYELLKVTRKVGMAEVLPAAYLLCVWNCKDMVSRKSL